MTEDRSSMHSPEDARAAKSRAMTSNLLVLLGAAAGAVVGLLAYTQNWLG